MFIISPLTPGAPRVHACAHTHTHDLGVFPSYLEKISYFFRFPNNCSLIKHGLDFLKGADADSLIRGYVF